MQSKLDQVQSSGLTVEWTGVLDVNFALNQFTSLQSSITMEWPGLDQQESFNGRCWTDGTDRRSCSVVWPLLLLLLLLFSIFLLSELSPPPPSPPPPPPQHNFSVCKLLLLLWLLSGRQAHFPPARFLWYELHFHNDGWLSSVIMWLSAIINHRSPWWMLCFHSLMSEGSESASLFPSLPVSMLWCSQMSLSLWASLLVCLPGSLSARCTFRVELLL